MQSPHFKQIRFYKWGFSTAGLVIFLALKGSIGATIGDQNEKIFDAIHLKHKTQQILIHRNIHTNEYLVTKSFVDPEKNELKAQVFKYEQPIKKDSTDPESVEKILQKSTLFVEYIIKNNQFISRMGASNEWSLQTRGPTEYGLLQDVLKNLNFSTSALIGYALADAPGLNRDRGLNVETIWALIQTMESAKMQKFSFSELDGEFTLDNENGLFEGSMWDSKTGEIFHFIQNSPTSQNSIVFPDKILIPLQGKQETLFRKEDEPPKFGIVYQESEAGWVIWEVWPGSVADSLQLKIGDTITEINGETSNTISSQEFLDLVSKHISTITVLSQDGSSRSIDVPKITR